MYSLGMVFANEIRGFLNRRPNESRVLESSVSTPVCGTKLRLRSGDWNREARRVSLSWNIKSGSQAAQAGLHLLSARTAVCAALPTWLHLTTGFHCPGSVVILSIQ